MEISEKVTRFWTEFCVSESVDPATPFQVWYFGNTPEMARELAELVITGKKIATASLVAFNEITPEESPVPDGISVVTDLYGEPMCVIQTVEIRHVPFNEVDAQFAYDEGEGDLSLDFWRSAHWNYFTHGAAESGLDFNERSLICCERFKLLFP
ncbi:MAG: ASCH domain-containing protein [Acidobacteria bacterium]|nr:ASCH domain-containing protein [Acidobacteriota bacterium]